MLFPEIFLKAPPELIPVPFNVKGSALIEVVISKAAPSETVVPEVVPPSPELLETLNTPLDTVVAPLNVLVPDNNTVPV